MLITETFCTKQMRWFGRMGSFFRRKSVNASSHIVRFAQIRQLVCLCLSIPLFKISDLFFQVAYLLKQRRLIIATRNRALLSGQNLFVHLSDPVLDLDTNAEIEQRLANLKSRLERLKARRDGRSIGHGE